MIGRATNRIEEQFEGPRATAFQRLRHAFLRNPAHWCWIGVSILLGAYVVALMANWAVVNAVWGADDVGRCEDVSGACWSVIAARHRIILFGLYPYEQQWRAAAGCIIVIGMVVLTCVPAFWSVTRLMTVWIVGFALFVALVRGGHFGLSLISSEKWGGLTLTLFIFACVLLIGMPVALVLALARRSNFLIYRWISSIAVDATRSLPFLMILYGAAIILPIALPRWINGDRLTYVVLGFSFYFACYQSEVLRGGLQTISKGQHEAAMALGLSYWKRMHNVILPQVFRVTLPPTVNEFVTVLKETSVVAIVGLFDLTASAHAAYEEGKWNHYYVEVYVFIGVIYFVFAYSLGQYGRYLETRLSTSRK